MSAKQPDIIVASCNDCHLAQATHGADGLGALQCDCDDHFVSANIDPDIEICPRCPMAGRTISWPGGDA